MFRSIGSCAILVVLASNLAAQDKLKDPPVLRSAQSGVWSSPKTWEGGKVPAAGARVQVREGHAVVYDVSSTDVIRSIHIGGSLSFDSNKDTRLDVGLIKIQPGDDASENGFDCDGHIMELAPGKVRPVFAVGTQEEPISAKYKALIRLTYVEGLDKLSCPAIVNCGGRWDMHGSPLNRAWVRLAADAKKGDRHEWHQVKLQDSYGTVVCGVQLAACS